MATSFLRQVSAGLVASSCVAVAAMGGGASCKAATDTTTSAEGGSDGACVADPVPEHRSFDPSAFDHTCTVDSDCTMVTAARAEPGSDACFLDCCSLVGVRANEAVSAARARLHMACCVFIECAAKCAEVQVTCVMGECVLSRPDAGVADSGDAAID